MYRQAFGSLEIQAAGTGLHMITDKVETWLAAQSSVAGIVSLFCRHTSASLLIQENAAPDAGHDLEAYFARIAPEGGPYRMMTKGPTTCRLTCAPRLHRRTSPFRSSTAG